MSDDPPPPYTAKDETKIKPELLPTASVSFNPQGGQAPAVPPQVPSAPLVYGTVSYYPASSSAGNAPVLLQPQQQQSQQQVIVIQSPQVVVVPQHPAVQGAQQSFAPHISLACCSLFCCFSCPFSIISFILAGECT